MSHTTVYKSHWDHCNFAFFKPLMVVIILAVPLPSFIHYISLFSHAPRPLHDPSHSPAPACPSYPFSLFMHYLWLSFCYQHLSPLLYIIFHSFPIPSTSCIIHPIPLALPAPPIFAFLCTCAFYPIYTHH